jgi:hypothetical protein
MLMKKLLLTISISLVTSSVFANSINFDQIKCGKTKITTNTNKNDIAVYCHNYSNNKNFIVFHDDNSNQMVRCKEDRFGNIKVDSCKEERI